jgi:hypothetical protein
MAWWCLAVLLNKTTIRAQRGLIEIRSGPIPCGGNKTFPTAGLEQLYAQEKVSHGKNGTSYSYELQALLSGNRREKLLAGLTDAEQALYIEQQLERYLGIEDRPVPGELPR